jgi:hypothetical protein
LRLGGGGTNVDEISGGMEHLSPEGSWQRCLEEEGTNDIIGGANGAFGLAILLGCIWTGESVDDAVGSAEGV